MKISEKDETNEDLVLFRDEKGRIRICESQVTIDDILANSEIVSDADDTNPEEEEPAEDDQEEEDGDHGEREESSGET